VIPKLEPGPLRTIYPVERRKTEPLGAALALKAAGTALHHRPEAFDDRTV
jgi:hypothetical protein